MVVDCLMIFIDVCVLFWLVCGFGLADYVF